MKSKEFQSVISKQDVDEILRLINEYNIPISSFNIEFKDNTCIAGIIGKNIKKSTKDFFKYSYFIESINDMATKTKYSIEQCVNCYLLVDFNSYNPFENNLSEQEKKVYYYMENALFREIILWDSLAQLYNIYFDLNLDINEIKYKSVINSLINKNDLDFKKLNNYIKEELDDNDIDIGIHRFVNDLRNKMTHRFSIAITSYSENYCLRAMPDSIYRIAKDNNMVMSKICEIIELITKKIINSNTIISMFDIENNE